ncbi:P-selectin glycoprotein ligand 1-like [Xyrauchen texanus]|uniref:P-selectin glycoprotein ligand 1-like n=1 Tax=Xyrauchen texanus TaxID=154827 RepID=UPI00224189DF|nr:P-selectin glycoprotein ligand 1-like [Xyrauchen texanus]
MYEPFLFAHKAKLTIRLKILNGSNLHAERRTKKEIKCEILTPRCTLSTFAQDYLQKIGSFYEYLCEGWTQDSSGNEDQLITLQLTPCEAESTEGQVEQVESTEGQVEQAESTEGQVEQAESTEGQVEQAESTEGQVEQAESTEGQVEQVESTEGQVEQAESTEGQVEQAESTEGQVEQAESTEGQVEQAESTEGQVEQAESTEGQVEQAESTEGQDVFTGSARGTVSKRKKKKSGGPRHMPERKRHQKRQSRNAG